MAIQPLRALPPPHVQGNDRRDEASCCGRPRWQEIHAGGQCQGKARHRTGGESRQGDKETRRQGDQTRQGDKETRRQGDQTSGPRLSVSWSPCLLVSSSGLLVSLSELDLAVVRGHSFGTR